MELIGTHDSATGEKGRGFISWILTPFAKTLSKTIRQLYDAGCRCFDIRVRKTKRGWICAHGLWKTKRLATDILKELNDMPETVLVELTYEGTTKERSVFEEGIKLFEYLYPRIRWSARAIKYGDKVKSPKVSYEIIKNGEPGCIACRQGFLPLDGHSWHTYLPIPWLWDKIYTRPHKFDDKKFTYVDFL